MIRHPLVALLFLTFGGKSTITNAGDGKASEAWSISRTAFE